MVAEGLHTFGYHGEARAVQGGLLHAYTHFQSPLELYASTRGRLKEYSPASGQKACRTQAWSAASLLAVLMDAAVDAAVDASIAYGKEESQDKTAI
jgi:glycogen debranching enzyme